MSKELFVSASRIKKLTACTFAYWKVYGPEPLPNISNDGSRIGSCCHYILEYLLKNKRRAYVTKIRTEGSLYIYPSIIRYIKLRAKKEELEVNDQNLIKIDRYCLVALNNDFYCDGAKLESAEKEFRIENEKPYYKIMGYIDKQAKKNNSKIIYDYKSQKKLFEGEELTDNVQGLMYCLAALKEDPTCDPQTKFIFLQFPNDPIFIFKPEKRVLTGFEHYLSYIYDRMKNFTEADAHSDFAFDQGYPKPNTGFKGRLICGRASYPGQLKKNGEKMWHCPIKFRFNYFAVKDKKTNETKKSYFTKEEIKLNNGEKIVEMSFSGCPKFNQKQDLDI